MCMGVRCHLCDLISIKFTALCTRYGQGNNKGEHAMTSHSNLFTSLVAAALLTACAPDTRDPDISVERGKQLYDQKCAACHGADAVGAGPESLGLGTPPPDLTTLKAQNRGIFPQNFVMSVIDGFDRRDHLNSVMPEFGNEDLGPNVQVEDGGVSTPIPSDLIALSAYLESIQR